ncbi:BglG family transcription antiterminator [Salinibacillus kushneri]|nr:BglG family transcription antiterminator [Salinibacillus kushneri]
MKRILRELLASQSALSGNYLANINQVSSRTIRDDIKKMNDLLSSHRAKISSVMGQGYKLNIQDNKEFFQFIEEELNEDAFDKHSIPKSPEERVAFLIKRLLLSEGYIKLEDLADEIYVSKSTIQNDLKAVKNRLARFDITWEARPNYGLKIRGTELKLRFCMSEYLIDHTDEANELHEIYDSAFSQKILDTILKIILKKLNNHHITLSDIAIHNLLIHIAIAYKRIHSGFQVDLYQGDIQHLKNKKEFEVAQEIVHDVEEVFDVKFPQPEVAYITMHLLGTKMILEKNRNGEGKAREVIDNDTYRLLKISLQKVEKELKLGIQNDEELFMGLQLHLKPAINRYKYGMNIRNPMLEDIKKNYPLAFEAGLVFSLSIEDEINIKMDENEVGYIALHIGAAMERKRLKSGPKRCLIVCASGYGTAQLIYYKLKTQFYKDVEVVGTTEYYKLNKFDLNHIDFIVSSIPISEQLPVPVIEVNAILGDNDLGRIRSFVIDNHKSISFLFRQDLMFLQQSFNSKEETLEHLTSNLEKRGLVDNNFLELVYERENIAPTSFGNLVAIPHPIKPQSRETFVSVCTLKKPITWHDKSVQFVCLLCVKEGSTEDLEDVYKLLGSIIDNAWMVQQLLRAKDYKVFTEMLDNIM